MQDNVVEIPSREHRRPIPAQVPDFWFAQVDMRLSRIELMVNRLEWQIWLIVCGAAGLFVIELIKILKSG